MLRLDHAFAFVLSLTWLLLPEPAQANEADAELRLLTDIIKIHTQRERIYGNARFTWNEIEVTDGIKNERKIEFWSRDDRYYRVDVTQVNDDGSLGDISRTIVRPEGTVRLKAKSRDDDGTIYDFGPQSEGMDAIKGNVYYCQANKKGHVLVNLLLENWLNNETEINDLSIINADQSGPIIAYSREFQGGLGQYTITLSPMDYRVLASTYSYQRASDSYSANQDSKTEYGDTDKDIPLTYSDVATDSSGGRDTLVCTLRDYELTPAPMDVFQVSDFAFPGSVSPTQIWGRRAIVLVLAVVCLVIYVRFNRSRTSRGS